MDKKVLQSFVQKIVDDVVTAHGNETTDTNAQTMGRSLVFMALKKNANAIIAATNPPKAETEETDA